jgi:hypothetical protein
VSLPNTRAIGYSSFNPCRVFSTVDIEADLIKLSRSFWAGIWFRPRLLGPQACNGTGKTRHAVVSVNIMGVIVTQNASWVVL